MLIFTEKSGNKHDANKIVFPTKKNRTIFYILLFGILIIAVIDRY